MQMSRSEAGGVWEDPQNALMGKAPRRQGDLCTVPQMHIRPHDAQEADESLSPNWILMVISLTELISISPAGFGGRFELGLLWPALVVIRTTGAMGVGARHPIRVANGTVQGTNAWSRVLMGGFSPVPGMAGTGEGLLLRPLLPPQHWETSPSGARTQAPTGGFGA